MKLKGLTRKIIKFLYWLNWKLSYITDSNDTYDQERAKAMYIDKFGRK